MAAWKRNVLQRKKRTPFEICHVCGAHLDHGEKCDCEEIENRRNPQTAAGLEMKGQ